MRSQRPYDIMTFGQVLTKIWCIILNLIICLQIIIMGSFGFCLGILMLVGGRHGIVAMMSFIIPYSLQEEDERMLIQHLNFGLTTLIK